MTFGNNSLFVLEWMGELMRRKVGFSHLQREKRERNDGFHLGCHIYSAFSFTFALYVINEMIHYLCQWSKKDYLYYM